MTENSPNLDSYLQQLYEDERLTGGLTDDDAKLLLAWGASQLESAAVTKPDEVESLLRQLSRILRTISSVVANAEAASSVIRCCALPERLDESTDLAKAPLVRGAPARASARKTSPA